VDEDRDAIGLVEARIGETVEAAALELGEADVALARQTLPRDIYEVVLVDGNSVDDTVEVARRLRPDVRVVRQTGKGKGNALACGFGACRGDIIVMLDADGSTDPGEITAFVDALLAGADFAKGSRFMAGGGSADITPVRSLGNKFLNGVFNLGFRTRYSDLCYGYNAFWADLIPLLDLPDHTAPAPAHGKMMWGDGFEIETVINCRFAAAGVAITEVPSVEKLRMFGESNLRAISEIVISEVLTHTDLPLEDAIELQNVSHGAVDISGWWISDSRERGEARRWMTDWHVKAESPDSLPDTLSGGNQQKVLIAKWVATSPRVLLLDEPTRGVDVGAKAEIHRTIQSLASAGLACVVVSSDLPEVLALADRILVMREGRLQGELPGAGATEEAVMHLATTDRAAS